MAGRAVNIVADLGSRLPVCSAPGLVQYSATYSSQYCGTNSLTSTEEHPCGSGNGMHDDAGTRSSILNTTVAESFELGKRTESVPSL